MDFALDPARFGIFLVAAAVIALTPGPGILFVAARTLAGGRTIGFASTIGTGIGGLVHVAGCAVGLSALMLASAEAFTLAKLAGAAYLIWLGLRGWREASAPLTLAPSGAPGGRLAALRDGAAVEALNPKTAAFFLAFLPQFADPAGALAPQLVALGLVSVLLNTAVDAVVVVLAARMLAAAARRTNLLRRLRRASAAMLCGLGAALAFARRPG